jgi:hypothetical protein
LGFVDERTHVDCRLPVPRLTHSVPLPT